MGSCLSLDQEELKARARSAAIDKQLRASAKEEETVVKILLLGAAESGKSTLVKQMKIIHNDGFSKDELLAFRPAVLDNLLNSMKYVLAGMGILRINLDDSRNRLNAQKVLACNCCMTENQTMIPYVWEALYNLWMDKGVRLAVSRGYEYELNDSAIYYFENMNRICSSTYIPNSTDVLRARVRTTGVLETCFRINYVIFRMFDVGGQRSERRKWIQCFDDVRGVLFVVALSSYDMCLYEDHTVNRLQESLTLFKGICNNSFFYFSCMILFLNKLDLFKDKILHSHRHLHIFFPEYKGSIQDVDVAAMYIQNLFQMQNRNQYKVIYPHFTTATDTSNIQVVFEVVMESILKENLKAAALL
ncbi:guanine nucleotide-binding protein G(o) subunit alpha [Octopus bimaculoides]|uniref:Guanine nucleotide-binding protein G(O) subunit alpha n=1 Tax=Octopus bimaculoides TaxID=37653 RepID=A0A0L8H4X6_OCTBM|nr:guanine nucleotide-binding protein G(o) subunit alpha [Octopus bimaculoides]|eukprot:XP_014775701.1 PREDICTED: guanine nucleotide-binding protein G(o) subunit alpha-like [Octopus bimaculoides]